MHFWSLLAQARMHPPTQTPPAHAGPLMHAHTHTDDPCLLAQASMRPRTRSWHYLAQCMHTRIRTCMHTRLSHSAGPQHYLAQCMHTALAQSTHVHMRTPLAPAGPRHARTHKHTQRRPKACTHAHTHYCLLTPSECTHTRIQGCQGGTAPAPCVWRRESNARSLLRE